MAWQQIANLEWQLNVSTIECKRSSDLRKPTDKRVESISNAMNVSVPSRVHRVLPGLAVEPDAKLHWTNGTTARSLPTVTTTILPSHQTLSSGFKRNPGLRHPRLLCTITFTENFIKFRNLYYLISYPLKNYMIQVSWNYVLYWYCN